MRRIRTFRILGSQATSRAFTLIELLVVIGVIAILAAFLFPVFAQARDKARQAACFSNLRQIGTALAIYLQDYDGRLPNCCTTGRAWTWTWSRQDLSGACRQVGITASTPRDTFLGPEQTPPRYVQELLHSYTPDAYGSGDTRKKGEGFRPRLLATLCLRKETAPWTSIWKPS